MNISVVIPVYNVGAFLKKTLDSVINQIDFEKIELILVDDGSTDVCVQICDDYANRFNNVFCLHIPNGGVSNARNEGLKNANGDYIIFWDSDDIIPQGTIRNYLKVMERRPDVIIGKTQRIFLEKKKVCDCVGPDCERTLFEEKKDFFNELNVVSERWVLDYIWNKCFKKDLLKKCNAFFEKRISLGEDFYFNCYVLRCAESIKLIPSLCYCYFIRGSSLVSAFQNDALWLRHAMIERHRLFYESQNLLTEDREKEICSYQGFLAFGAFRSVNSTRCSLDKEEKDAFLKLFVDDSIFDLILFYLKNDKRIPQKVMYFLLRKRKKMGLKLCVWIDLVIRKIKGA